MEALKYIFSCSFRLSACFICGLWQPVNYCFMERQILQNFSFCAPQKNNSICVWKDMIVSKLWENDDLWAPCVRCFHCAAHEAPARLGLRRGFVILNSSDSSADALEAVFVIIRSQWRSHPSALSLFDAGAAGRKLRGSGFDVLFGERRGYLQICLWRRQRWVLPRVGVVPAEGLCFEVFEEVHAEVGPLNGAALLDGTLQVRR